MKPKRLRAKHLWTKRTPSPPELKTIVQLLAKHRRKRKPNLPQLRARQVQRKLKPQLKRVPHLLTKTRPRRTLKLSRTTPKLKLIKPQRSTILARTAIPTILPSWRTCISRPREKVTVGPCRDSDEGRLIAAKKVRNSIKPEPLI